MNSSKKYNVFISHSSKDKKISDLLCNLMIKAGLTVWYDENSMLPNTSLTTDIPKYISNSEVLLVVLSKNSCDSRWVEEEYNYAKELLYKQELKIIPIVVDDCKLPGFYNNYKWIDCREGLDCFSFFKILSAIYGETENIREIKDIYVSYSWRQEERSVVDAVFTRLIRSHYRLIGDASDHYSYDDGKRIRKIMNTCGAFVGILPFREATNTSRYIIDEIHQAAECCLPGLIIADSRVEGLDDMPYPIYRYDNPDEINEHSLKDIMTKLTPRKPKTSHVFYATQLGIERSGMNSMIRNISGVITATRCVLGEDINLGNLQQQIIDRIRSSYVMIADITDERFNTCIEAGIARGAGVDLYLVAKNKRHTPPFMFRDMNVLYYNDECELLAIIHRVLRPYRRKVLRVQGL